MGISELPAYETDAEVIGGKWRLVEYMGFIATPTEISRLFLHPRH
jgi:hypothetical protein